MAEKEINGTFIALDDEGYMTDNTQWNEEIARELAKEIEIHELSEDHWKVNNFIRKEYEILGSIPTIRKISKKSGEGYVSL